MKAFVTGSTGFVASNLIPLLIKKGFKIKALARSLEKAHVWIENPNIEIIVGDMQHVDDFALQIADCDVVFHLAAYYREYMGSGTDIHLLEKINVAGTMKFIEAARRQAVRNIIYVSSAGVVNSGVNGPADESAPTNENTANLYFRSKIKAEKEIDHYLTAHDDMRIILIRPSLMMGPGDNGPTPAGQFILNYLKQSIPAVLPGNMPVVDVRDVAIAMTEAIDKGQSGDRFFIGGRTYELAELMEALERASGIPCPKKRPAYWLAYLMLFIADKLGKEMPIKPRDLKRMQSIQAPLSTKARKILGLQMRSIDETINDAVGWFRLHQKI